MGCCIQKLCKFVNSKMAAGGHFEFCGLLELAHTFGRGTPANFFYWSIKEDKSTAKHCSALHGHEIVSNDPTIVPGAHITISFVVQIAMGSGAHLHDLTERVGL